MSAASVVLAIAMGVATAGELLARCGEGPTDAQDVADARGEVATVCDCSATTPHGRYVACAADVANRRAKVGLLARQCKGAVRRCAARSSCGKPGFVTCCVTKHDGPRCKVARDAATCATMGGNTGACPSCCDACSGGCPTTTTSTVTTTSTTLTGPHCGDFPDCNGGCPDGTRCAHNFDGPECRCFPVDVTPCFESGYPACGGVCLDGKVCQAAKGTDGGLPVFDGCACVGAGSLCGEPPDTCDFGLCPPGEECVADAFPGRDPLCPQTGCRPLPTASTTTTTVTTASTTTTTQLACQNSTPDTCGGTCPSGSICVVFDGDPRTCGCAPDGSQPCGNSAFPYCNGTCPDGEQCGRTAPAGYIIGSCACVPAGGPACGDATYPTCEGGCPSTQQCVPFKTSDGATFCSCSPDSPCTEQCFTGGVCPTGMVCLLAFSGPCGCTAP